MKRADFQAGKKSKPGFWQSLKAYRQLPYLFALVWETSAWRTAAILILRSVSAVLPLGQLYFGKRIIDEVIALSGSEGDLVWFPLATFVIAELLLVLTGLVLGRFTNLNEAILGDLFSQKTSIGLMEHSANLDLANFEDPDFYDRLERARRQTTARVVLLSQIATQIQDAIAIVSLAVGIVAIEPLLLLIVVLSVLPGFVSENIFNQAEYSLSRSWTSRRRELDYLRFIGASDETVKEVKLFSLSSFIVDRFRAVSSKYLEENKKLIRKRNLWGVVFGILGQLAYYFAYALILFQAVTAVITVGTLTFLSGAFQRLSQTFQNFASRFSTIANSAMYLQDLIDFYNVKPKIASAKEAFKPDLDSVRGDIDFESVHFTYPGSETAVLSGVSFHLASGQSLALVGENGAGKTTLVKLLTRLYDVNKGRILIDGVDIREWDLERLRQVIGMIFQDFVRYQFSLSENIAVGQIDAVDDGKAIEQAAEKSLADEVAEALPEGYEQRLGKRFFNGTELSGGQWQKVALARAYIRRASVLILDEPTAALDAKAEYAIFQRFRSLTKGKTAILISHRFSTVRMADMILVLEHGKVLEHGSHESLLKKKGRYAELFNLQAEGYR